MQAKQLNLVSLYLMLLAMSATAIFAIVAKSSGLVLNVTGSMPGIVYKLGRGEKEAWSAFAHRFRIHPSVTARALIAACL